ncbi:hypothetical protein AA0Y32_07700 [Georgenia phoenicis]|uniref:hypothetical protein n=1 Tax=unclassified Georgenia TaxID=2626815 RepID=UPI0039B0678C
MSAMPARTAAVEPRRSWRPRLQVVRSPAPARSLVPYLVLCATILLGSLVAALLINTQMAVDAYAIHDAQRSLNRLVEAETSLVQQVEEAGSPASLQRKAEELGMVPAERVDFISLREGTILGGSDPQ